MPENTHPNSPHYHCSESDNGQWRHIYISNFNGNWAWSRSLTLDMLTGTVSGSERKPSRHAQTSGPISFTMIKNREAPKVPVKFEMAPKVPVKFEMAGFLKEYLKTNPLKFPSLDIPSAAKELDIKDLESQKKYLDFSRDDSMEWPLTRDQCPGVSAFNRLWRRHGGGEDSKTRTLEQWLKVPQGEFVPRREAVLAALKGFAQRHFDSGVSVTVGEKVLTVSPCMGISVFLGVREAPRVILASLDAVFGPQEYIEIKDVESLFAWLDQTRGAIAARGYDTRRGDTERLSWKLTQAYWLKTEAAAALESFDAFRKAYEYDNTI